MKFSIIAEGRYAEYRYGECHYAECRYSKFRGAIQPPHLWVMSLVVYHCAAGTQPASKLARCCIKVPIQ
jgi:hypothetical protein